MIVRQKQGGVALVTALLVVAIAVVLASTLVDQLYLDIRRTENVIQGDQAYSYAAGLEEFVKIALKTDAELNDFDDKLQLEEANNYLVAPVEGGQVIGNLVDLQGRFNLNNLSKTNSNQAQALQQFQALLTALGLDPNLSYAVADWIDSDQLVDNPVHGAEFDYYIGLPAPYRSADTLMSSPSELRLVKGFNDPEIYRQVIDHVSALPEFTTININTASSEVINSIDGIESADVEQIILRRDGSGEEESGGASFEQLNDFETYMKNPPFDKKQFSTTGLSVASDYFLLTTTSQVGNGKVILYSMLHRDAQGNASVIGRSQGAW